MADINKVWMSGLVITQPVLTRISEKTPIATFTLQINEQFRDRSGQIQVKPNLIKIESLGKSAEMTLDKVFEGKRYIVDGYLRQDRVQENEEVRVRTFAVYPDESHETRHYKDGLTQAIKILANSHDLSAALGKLKVLLDNS
jgi:single stranded DNA-binding protein